MQKIVKNEVALDIKFCYYRHMAKIATQKYIRVPREDYMRLKGLQKHFGAFWNYIEHIRDIKEARQQVRAKKTIAQEDLFRELGL